ncbi:hypothetical protein [Halocella sp. SP3-1]|uniref:hypothetical protein n=1 Tax=Halocella sp. SP3-1 TaxID=2382161 RepID=UPI000F7617ED|nr:hypothetical protein [Halocella sp. SP3-1]AZO95793.1 hypothetical protein D7D81_15020 [Halocella sp. SP3-1]
MSRNKFIKKTLVLLISLTLMFTLAACNKEEELMQEVKVEKEIPEYVLVKETIKEGVRNNQGPISGSVEYEYDDRGNVTRITYKNGDGEVIENKEYKYNEKGLKVERNITKVVEDTSKYRWRSGSYDIKELNKDRIIKENMHEALGKSIYKYNFSNQLILYERYNIKGEKVEWINFEYHRNGDMKCRKRDTIGGFKKTTEYNRDGKWTKVVSYFPFNGSKRVQIAKYGKDGNRIENIKKDYNKKGKSTLFSHYKMVYDETGNMIKFIDIDDGKSYTIYDLEYDEKGNLIKEINYYNSGDIHWIKEYEYDEKGKKISFVKKNAEGNIRINSKYNYKYDENGNLVEDDFQIYEYEKLNGKKEE